MSRFLTCMGMCVVSLAAQAVEHTERIALPASDAQRGSAQEWVERSNTFTRLVVDVDLQHSPERGSSQGMAQFDERISDPSLADQLAQRRELEAVAAKLTAAGPKETDARVREDLEILHKALDLRFRLQDYELAHEVPFANASEVVFQGLRVLLEDQVAAQRRPAAVTRLLKYTGLQTPYQPITQVLEQRALEQMAKPGVIYPAKDEIETELGRNQAYVEGIRSLFVKYRLTGWQAGYERLERELADYDAWIRANVLPKARTDFRLPRARYELAFEQYGIDISPEQIAAQAHSAFQEYQGQMSRLAATIARRRISLQRLSRSDRAAQEEADHRHGYPAFLRTSPAPDRRHHPRKESRLPAQPAGHHSSCHAGRDRRATGAPHGPACAAAQHRPARRVRAAAQHSVRDGRVRGPVR